MSIEYVKCPKCGNSDFKTLADTKPDDIVTCTQCGFTTTYAKYQAMLDAMIDKTVEDAATKLVEGIKKRL